MNKHLRQVFLVLIIIVGIFSLSACGKKKAETKVIDERVIGTWKYESDYIIATYVFRKDGTGSYTITVGEETVLKTVAYYTENDTFYINYDEDPDTFELKYSVSNEGITIIDSLGDELLYEKQED